MKDACYLERRGIALQCDPPPHILKKTRRIMAQMDQGVPYWKLRGKRLKPHRKMISIPIGLHWRLVGKEQNGRIVWKQLLSHESYNSMLHRR